MPFHRMLALVLVLASLSGCSSQLFRDMGLDKASRKAEQTLSQGIQQYEDGDLKAAQKSIQDAVNMGLAFDADKVNAHKHLAFIYCASNQEKLCRDEFRRAFDVDPGFKLQANEIGHPLWGPVYKSVRAELIARGKVKP